MISSENTFTSTLAFPSVHTNTFPCLPYDWILFKYFFSTVGTSSTGLLTWWILSKVSSCNISVAIAPFSWDSAILFLFVQLVFDVTLVLKFDKFLKKLLKKSPQ